MINDYDKEKAKLFFERKIKVHVSKKNGEFLNGLILEFSKDFFVINDRVKGEQFVFFNELSKPLERYIEREDDNNERL